jgi:predicted 3-demethylubiquinone-9 3-methyltransferase (glyoxalase superfamily)
MAISAGPIFKLNPSISFFVNFDPSRDPEAKEHLTAAWEKFSEGGQVLMPLQEYPFSKWYGWIQDKYGVSWQLMLTNPGGEERPFIIPSLMFVGDVAGKAEEATDYYISIFKDSQNSSKRGNLARYPEGTGKDEGTLMFTDFNLTGTWIAAMDSAGPHKFGFNEAISLLISCETQEEIDYFWEKLSTVPEAEQCGWCKDKWGVSWQVWPTEMGKMMSSGTPEQIDRVTKAFMPMKKFDIAKLKDAFEGK